MMKFLAITIMLIWSFSLSAQKVNTSLTYSVNLPQGSGKRPVLILLHGYGSNESDLLDISKAFDPQLITFSVRGPIPTSGDGYCWYKLDYDDKGKRQYDYKQVKESREKVLSFISNACRAYNADSSSVYLLGFSQGAILSYDLLLNAPSRIKGVLALSGRMMDETSKVPVDPKKLANTSVFIAHGTSDNVIAMSESEKASSVLKTKGVQNLSFKKYEMPHTINGAELNDIKIWLNAAVKK